MTTIGLVKENLNPELEVEGVLLTMADYRTRLTNEVIAEVKNYFSAQSQESLFRSSKVYETIIPRNIRLTEAPGFGKPVFLYDKHSIGAAKYQDFANEVLGVKNEILDEMKSGSSPEEVKTDEAAIETLNEIKGEA
jgi:chromosome partitioning protein